MLQEHQLHSKDRYTLPDQRRMFVVLGFDDDEDVERYMLYELPPDCADPVIHFSEAMCEEGLGLLPGAASERLGGLVYGEWLAGVSKQDLLQLMNAQGFVYLG